MSEISLSKIEKSYGVEIILKNATFEVHKGERIALIGRNGAGKTTLFKIILGEESLDNGQINIRKNCKIGCLDQIPNYSDDYKVIDVLNEVFEETFELRKKIEIIENKMSKHIIPNSNNSKLNNILIEY